RRDHLVLPPHPIRIVDATLPSQVAHIEDIGPGVSALSIRPTLTHDRQIRARSARGEGLLETAKQRNHPMGIARPHGIIEQLLSTPPQSPMALRQPCQPRRTANAPPPARRLAIELMPERAAGKLVDVLLVERRPSIHRAPCRLLSSGGPRCGFP